MTGQLQGGLIPVDRGRVLSPRPQNVTPPWTVKYLLLRDFCSRIEGRFISPSILKVINAKEVICNQLLFLVGIA